MRGAVARPPAIPSPHSAPACVSYLCLQKKDVAAKREASWKVKMERSPFHVDLVAEHERIDEVRGV